MTVANISSENWCRRAYLNYHLHGNTMGISPEVMGEIAYTWADKLASWQASASSDETEYDFDDSEYETYVEEGKAAGEEATGYEKNQGGDIGGLIGRGLSTGASLYMQGTTKLTIGISTGVGKEAAKAATTEGAKAIGKHVAGGVAKEGAKEAGKKALENSLSWSIGAVMALATGTAYIATQPNKEEKEACDILQTEMAGAQGELMDKQSEMDTIQGEITSLSDEANEYNEEANATIADQKSEYDFLMQTYTALKAKIDAGQPLEESEKSLYKDCVKYMQQSSAGVEETADAATDEVSSLYDEIGGYQENYDGVAESMGEVQGLTEYAGSFDEAARALCFVEAGVQGLNVVSGTVAAVQAGLAAAATMGCNVWAWACVAMGTAGAVFSGIGVGQQIKYGTDIGKEIEARGITETANTDTMSMYEEEIDGFDATMQGVEDLELIMPDDIEAPEAAAIPTTPAPTNGPEKTPKKEPEKQPGKKE